MDENKYKFKSINYPPPKRTVQNVLGQKSKMYTRNILLIHKIILKPIWTSIVNIEILELFQLKALSMLVDALWYVPNIIFRKDLRTQIVKEQICRYSSRYSVRLSTHPNDLIMNLVKQPENRRFGRQLPNYPPTRF
jgi:hypothetical protein